MEEMSGELRRLHSEKLRKLNASPNIIRWIKSSRMKFSGHVRWEIWEMHIKFWSENLK
jgi:hypothetical protein